MLKNASKENQALLWVAVETGFLHGVNGVPQELVRILLATEAEMSGDFCRKNSTCD